MEILAAYIPHHPAAGTVPRLYRSAEALSVCPSSVLMTFCPAPMTAYLLSAEEGRRGR
jgi:hypothetical protein